MFNPGDKLFDLRKGSSAQVRADGSLVAKDKQSGSIHALGAKLQIFLHAMAGHSGMEKVKDTAIDELRKQIRAENDAATTINLDRT